MPGKGIRVCLSRNPNVKQEIRDGESLTANPDHQVIHQADSNRINWTFTRPRSHLTTTVRGNYRAPRVSIIFSFLSLAILLLAFSSICEFLFASKRGHVRRIFRLSVPIEGKGIFITSFDSLFWAEIFFCLFQTIEYLNSFFYFNDRIYGSIFFITTGFINTWFTCINWINFPINFTISNIKYSLFKYTQHKFWVSYLVLTFCWCNLIIFIYIYLFINLK